MDSYTVSLESFKSFRGLLFCKSVTGQETFFAVSYSKPTLKAFLVFSLYNLIWHLFLFSAWLEASFQDELDPGNAQHEEHARNLVVTLVQQLETKALESGDFLTKNKLEEIIASIKVRLKLFKLSCGVSS